MQKHRLLEFHCLPNRLALMGLRPVFFGPCTLGRTWGTRPGKRASLLPSTATPPMDLHLCRFHFCSLFASGIAAALRAVAHPGAAYECDRSIVANRSFNCV